MEDNNLTLTPTDEFFKHCGEVDSCFKTYINGYEYIDVIDKGNDVIFVISNAPMHGNCGTYQSTDINAKDITVDDALKNLKLKYKDKNMKIIYLQK